MRFNEWWAAIQRESIKVKQNPIYQVSESICVDALTRGESASINITLDKDGIGIDINGNTDLTYRDLRPLYSPHKEEFDALLESIIEQNRELAESAQVLLQAVGDEMIPDLTLKRLAGESLTNEESGGVLMVKALTKKKLDELGELFWKIPEVMETYTLSIEIQGKSLTLSHAVNKQIRWASLERCYQPFTLTTMGDVNDCLALIAHFDEFKAVLDKLKAGMKNLASLLNK